MKRLYLLIFMACMAFSLQAQQNMTLYQMHDVPQSNMLNPAVPISCGWIVGIPALGGVSLAAGAPLSYNNLGAGNEVLQTDAVLSKLHNHNVVSANGTVNLILVGYRTPKNYFQFTVNERFHEISTISKAPLELLLKGNASYVGQTVTGEPAISAMYYREYAFTMAHEIDPTMWIGGRAKLMFGRLGIHSTGNSANFYTNPGTYNLTLTSDLKINASIPGTVELDPVTGKVNSFNADIQASDFIFNPSNIGAGLDLGITKDLDNGMQVSASVLNIGFINWSKNPQTFRQNGTVNFNGPFAPIDELNALVDTLKSFLDLNYSQETFTQWAAPVVMAGGNYPVADWARAGLTGMVEIQPKSIMWAATATAFTQGLPVVDLGLSYTITPYSYFNVGFGVNARLGAFNFHLFTDNIIAAIKPYDSRYATVQLGMSLRFGCGSDDDNDKPARREAVPCPAFQSSIKDRECVPCSAGASSGNKVKRR